MITVVNDRDLKVEIRKLAGYATRYFNAVQWLSGTPHDEGRPKVMGSNPAATTN